MAMQPTSGRPRPADTQGNESMNLENADPWSRRTIGCAVEVRRTLVPWFLARSSPNTTTLVHPNDHH